MSRVYEGIGGQNQVVSGLRTYNRFPTRADHCQNSEQVGNFDYGGIGCLTSGSSAPGELPPPPPRAFFGREELIDKIVCFADRLTPIALIGAGGIGKTSIILTVLHDDRIKQRFGQDRRFIRCDEFPASRAHFLRQLSTSIGAGIENPEKLSSLRPFLSSREILIVIDNAESILDPQGLNAQEIYEAVNELAQLNNICLCITSRISTVPSDCKTLEIPTLSLEAARDAFYQIYQHGERSDPINGILEQLDFHPLCITLLATVAQHNKWSTDRVTMEWERQRTRVLRAQHPRSLATTIELSLASPMFRELGTEARPLLEVVAFFPQGVNEKNTGWLLPTIPDVLNILDTFCALSLTYRNHGFITMLAPLRDHLRPKDPSSSPLLRTTKENYFMRLSGNIRPGKPGFEEGRWITTEDINVEHLLDVFTTTDASSEGIWDVCIKFMAQLYWHRPRLVTLGPKIEALPDGHPSKGQCLRELSRLFDSVGNVVECKRLLCHSLKLGREQEEDLQVARALRHLSNANRQINLYEEGMPQAKEAFEIFERLGDVVGQADTSIILALLLQGDGQLDAAEEAGLHAINLLQEKGEALRVCQAHRVLSETYRSKGETKKAIHHYGVALEIASSLGMVRQLFWINYSLAELYRDQDKYEVTQMHIEHAKPYAVNNPYLLARAMDQQARVWYGQYRFEEARSEALRALDAFEKLGAANDVETTRQLLHVIEAALDCSDSDGELLETILVVVHCVHSFCSDGVAESE